MATLTGAARVAVGADIAPFYTDDEELAAALAQSARAVADPVWRLPFHAPYEKLIEPGIADLDNAPKGGFAGSITAALFLRRFAPRPADLRAFRHLRLVRQRRAGPAQGRPRAGVARALRNTAEGPEPMTRDPRMTPSNGRIAHVSLQGEVEADSFVDGTWMTVQQPIANLAHDPGGNRASQLLFGERFLVLEVADGQAFGQAERDGYVGWVSSAALTQAPEATHWVISPATHLYPRADFKTQAEVALFFGSAVHVTSERQGFHRIQTGHFVPRQHLMPIAARFDDPVGVADLFLGTPYLWGGTSRWGLDCSGLVQLALRACGTPCPRDSDQQAEALGEDIDERETLQRGDLVFWKGHVGMMADAKMLLHANAHHMSVAYEPLKDAAARIETAGDGPVTRRKRISKT
jgi:cell wall-associated NlpC family hydrolase